MRFVGPSLLVLFLAALQAGSTLCLVAQPGLVTVTAFVVTTISVAGSLGMIAAMRPWR